jgi:hypothetical protein
MLSPYLIHSNSSGPLQRASYRHGILPARDKSNIVKRPLPTLALEK